VTKFLVSFGELVDMERNSLTIELTQYARQVSPGSRKCQNCGTWTMLFAANSLALPIRPGFPGNYALSGNQDAEREAHYMANGATFC